MTSPIGEDLGIEPNDQAWVLGEFPARNYHFHRSEESKTDIAGTYSLTFAATLLFSGRLADLYPPHIIYTVGFFGIGIFYLIISFMTDQYAFFVLRAISALAAVLTIPSSLNMMVQMYPDPVEQAQKLALFGMAGELPLELRWISLMYRCFGQCSRFDHRRSVSACWMGMVLPSGHYPRDPLLHSVLVHPAQNRSRRSISTRLGEGQTNGSRRSCSHHGSSHLLYPRLHSSSGRGLG